MFTNHTAPRAEARWRTASGARRKIGAVEDASPVALEDTRGRFSDLESSKIGKKKISEKQLGEFSIHNYVCFLFPVLSIFPCPSPLTFLSESVVVYITTL